MSNKAASSIPQAPLDQRNRKFLRCLHRLDSRPSHFDRSMPEKDPCDDFTRWVSGFCFLDWKCMIWKRMEKGWKGSPNHQRLSGWRTLIQLRNMARGFRWWTFSQSLYGLFLPCANNQRQASVEKCWYFNLGVGFWPWALPNTLWLPSPGLTGLTPGSGWCTHEGCMSRLKSLYLWKTSWSTVNT